MKRLSQATLDLLPADISRPRYDRATVATGVVHLGIGAFHRAHQAVYFDRLIAAGDRRWGIAGVSLRSPAVRDSMAPQDWLYSLAVRDDGHTDVSIIGALQQVLVAPEDPKAVVALLARPSVHIVTLTVTEKGYRLDRATGTLDASDPDIAADLASLDAPRSAAGFLVAGLSRRRAAGLPPFTAISCDNLPHNGGLLSAAVLAMARAHHGDLADWIERGGAFPSTMVDRIVPATDAGDIAAMAERLRVEDRATVKTEPFTQWVIEDRWASERPDLASAGVQLTADVAPWEEAKLRLLNGAHSAIAYLGGLAGHEFVDQVVATPEGRAMVEALWDETEVTLSLPPELDIAAYRAELMRRFANPALQHRTRQIAMDGSQKLPQRLVAPMIARRAMGLDSPQLARAIAGWIGWCGQCEIDDPLADTLATAWKDGATPTEAARRLLAIEAVFPPALADVDRNLIVAALERLCAEGPPA